MAPLPKLDKRKWKIEGAKIQGSSKNCKRTGPELKRGGRLKKKSNIEACKKITGKKNVKLTYFGNTRLGKEPWFGNLEVNECSYPRFGTKTI